MEPIWNRQDICEAYYIFAKMYLTPKQEDKIIARLYNKLGYRAKCGLRVETLSENGRAIFDCLIARNNFVPYNLLGD